MEQSQVYREILYGYNASINAVDRDTRVRVNDYLSSIITIKDTFFVLKAFITTLNDNLLVYYAAASVSSMEEKEVYGDSMRMLALTSMDSWIKEWFNKLSIDEQVALRTEIMSLISIVGSYKMKVLRCKLAIIISNMAELHYPQIWPTFVKEMVDVWLNGANQQKEIVVMALEYTCIDCIDTDFQSKLPTVRRQDILAALKIEMEPLLVVLYQSLVFYASDISSFHENEIFKGLLRLLLPIITFSKAEDICASHHNFGDIVIGLLNVPSLQMDAANVLSALTSNKMSIELFTHLLVKLTDMQPTYYPDVLTDKLAFCRTYAESVFSLVSNNFTHCTSTVFLEDATRQAYLGRYVQLMAQLLDQPSRRLAYDVIKDWLKIFKEDSIINLSWMQDCAKLVLKSYQKHIKRVIFDHSQDDFPVPFDEITEAEYIDYGEWVQFVNDFKQQARLLAGIIVNKFPVACLNYLVEANNQLISVYPFCNDHLHPALSGHGTQDSTAVIEWEAYCVMLDSILCKYASNANNRVNDDNVSSILLLLMRNIAEWVISTNDSLLIALKLKMLQSLSTLLNTPSNVANLGIVGTPAATAIAGNHDFLLRILLIAFEYMNISYSFSNPALDDLYLEVTIQTKTKAAISIATICQSCAATIASSSFVRDLVNQIASTLTNTTASPVTTHHGYIVIKNYLREALVSLVPHLGTPEDRQAILEVALGDVVQFMVSPFVASITATPADFITNILDVDKAKEMNNLRNALSTLYSITRQIENPILPDSVWLACKSNNSGPQYSFDTLQSYFAMTVVWKAVLPTILAVHSALLGVWDPAFKQQVIGQISEGSVLYQPILPENPNIPSPSKAADDANTKRMEATAKLMFDCRQFCFQLLGRAANHKVLYVCPAYPMGLLSVYITTNTAVPGPTTALLHMDNAHLAQFVNFFMESYLINAPPSAFTEVAVFMSVLFTHLTHRLLVAYGTMHEENAILMHIYKDCSISYGCKGYSNEHIESVREKVIVGLARQYADLLSAIACCRGYLAVSKTTKDAVNTAVAGSGWNVDDKSWYTSKSGATIEDEKERDRVVRRTSINHLLYQNPSNICTIFIESIANVLSIPDSLVLQRCVTVIEQLLERSLTDGRLVPIIAEKAFRTAVWIILHDPEYIKGFEWEVCDLVTQIYIKYVLGIDSEANPSISHRTITDVPRNILLHLPGVTPAMITELEQRIHQILKHKKRRDLFKDFFMKVLEINGMQKSNGGLAELFKHSTLNNVPDTQRVKKIFVYKKNDENAAVEDTNIGSASIFDDI